MKADVQRAEMCRKAVLEFLAARNSTAHRVEFVRQQLNGHRVGNWTDEEVRSACVFLEDVGALVRVKEQLSAALFWRATAKGVLMVEAEE